MSRLPTFTLLAIWACGVITSALGNLPFSYGLESKTSPADCFRAKLSGFCREDILGSLDSDPLKQWLIWEEIENGDFHMRPTSEGKMRLKKIPLELVDVRDIDSDLSKEILRLLKEPDSVLWPEHPLNRHSNVPFFSWPKFSRKSLRYRWTASRSLAIINEKGRPIFTLKMGTDMIAPRTREINKVEMAADVRVATLRTPYLNRMDQQLGKDSSFILLKDALALTQKGSNEGFLVRDLSPIDDGNYYLPAFAIPNFGRKIAEHHGVSFESFWEQHYAIPMGVLKAKLLLRYGLEMDTPSAQNFLIQLDKNLMPTGKLVVRDLSDTSMVDFIMKAYGEDAEFERNRINSAGISRAFHPQFAMAFSRMDPHQQGANGIAPTVEEAWTLSQERAFIAEIRGTLGLPVTDARPNNLDRLNMDVKTDQGIAALKKYRASLLK